MSRVTGNGVRIGESNTQTNNFSIETTNAGKLTLHRGNVGNNLGTVLEVDTAAGTSDLQIGSSATSTNNFHLKSDGAGGCALYRGNVGTTTTPVLTVDNAGLINVTKQLTLGTSQATTSGTSIDFTGIPSWVKRITVTLNGVSTNGASTLILQIGSGAVETTGYLGAITVLTAGVTTANLTTGLGVVTTSSISIHHGSVILSTMGSNKWVSSTNCGRSDAAITHVGGSSKDASGVIDRIRLTTVNGTDTFDAGSVNIMYE